eukprot:250033_1
MNLWIVLILWIGVELSSSANSDVPFEISFAIDITYDEPTQVNKCALIANNQLLQSIDDIYEDNLELASTLSIITQPQTHVTNCSANQVSFTTNVTLTSSSQNITTAIGTLYDVAIYQIQTLLSNFMALAASKLVTSSHQYMVHGSVRSITTTEATTQTTDYIPQISTTEVTQMPAITTSSDTQTTDSLTQMTTTEVSQITSMTTTEASETTEYISQLSTTPDISTTKLNQTTNRTSSTAPNQTEDAFEEGKPVNAAVAGRSFELWKTEWWRDINIWKFLVILMCVVVVMILCTICFCVHRQCCKPCTCKNTKSHNKGIRRRDFSMIANVTDAETSDDDKCYGINTCTDDIEIKIETAERHDSQTIQPLTYDGTEHRVSNSSEHLEHTCTHEKNALFQEIWKNERLEASQTSGTNAFVVPLFDEIIRNENIYRKYIKQHPRSPKSNQSNRRNTHSSKDNDESNNTNSHANNNNNNNNSDANNSNNSQDDHDDQKDEKKSDDDYDDMYSMADIEIMKAKAEQLKNKWQYKTMVKQNNALSDTELIALIYYTDKSSACRNMKGYHKFKTNENRWKVLYYHTTNGVLKMYYVFHYQNNKQVKITRLYHGSSIKALDGLSLEHRFLNTLWSFTMQFKVAMRFATADSDGSIWVMDKVYDALYSGRLRGANVAWISKFNEYEVVIIPTTFYEWKLMDPVAIAQNKWQIYGIDVNIYMTDQFISNNDAFCTHSDNELRFMSRSYSDIPALHVKKWINGFDFKKEDADRYYTCFVDNGYDSMDRIEMLNTEILKEIGIRKRGHLEHLIKSIEKMNASLNYNHGSFGDELHSSN